MYVNVNRIFAVQRSFKVHRNGEKKKQPQAFLAQHVRRPINANLSTFSCNCRLGKIAI